MRTHASDGSFAVSGPDGWVPRCDGGERGEERLSTAPPCALGGAWWARADSAQALEHLARPSFPGPIRSWPCFVGAAAEAVSGGRGA
jgi:hypothetical protein